MRRHFRTWDRMLFKRRRLQSGWVGILELNAQCVALDPNNATVSDYPVRFGHQLKTDRDMGCVWDLDRGPFNGDIGNGAAGAGAHIRNVSRSLNGLSPRSSSFLKHCGRSAEGHADARPLAPDYIARNDFRFRNNDQLELIGNEVLHADIQCRTDLRKIAENARHRVLAEPD